MDLYEPFFIVFEVKFICLKSRFYLMLPIIMSRSKYYSQPKGLKIKKWHGPSLFWYDSKLGVENMLADRGHMRTKSYRTISTTLSCSIDLSVSHRPLIFLLVSFNSTAPQDCTCPFISHSQKRHWNKSIIFLAVDVWTDMLFHLDKDLLCSCHLNSQSCTHS